MVAGPPRQWSRLGTPPVGMRKLRGHVPIEVDPPASPDGCRLSLASRRRPEPCAGPLDKCKTSCYILGMDGQPRTVTISVPPDLVRKIDAVARLEGRTRSELLREAVRQYLDRRDRWNRLFREGRRIAAERGIHEQDVVRAVKEYRRSRARR